MANHFSGGVSPEQYAETLAKSMNGKKQEAKPERKKKVPHKFFNMKKVMLCTACVVIGAISAVQLPKAVDKMVDNYNASVAIENQVGEFQKNYVFENMHPAANAGSYYYDTDKIAKHVESEDDIYTLWRCVGEKSADEVLSKTELGYSSIRDYLDKHNIADGDEWKKIENQKMVDQMHVNEKANELREMKMEYEKQYEAKPETVLDSAEKGGK